MKSEQTKENIIEKTLELLQESNGNTDEITIRKIAERAGVGIGLINHYFTSKDKLIEICVQRIINGVIHSFKPELLESSDPIDITKYVTKQVMDFLMENRQISRVSIIGDMNQPQQSDNTMGTVIGFARCLSGGNVTNEQKVNAFLLTAILQLSFLRKDLLAESFGIDFYNKKQRDCYIDMIIDKISN